MTFTGRDMVQIHAKIVRLAEEEILSTAYTRDELGLLLDAMDAYQGSIDASGCPDTDQLVQYEALCKKLLAQYKAMG